MGAGDSSNTVSAVVDVVPGAPTITGVGVGSGKASIAFTPGTNSGTSITNYEYSVNGGSSWDNAEDTSSPILVTGLTNGQTYTFRIRALNTMGAGAPSNSVSKLVDVVPGAPTINTVIVSNGKAFIAFTPGTNSGSSITNYEYSINGGSSWDNAEDTSSPIIVTGLTNGQTYNFSIRAVNDMGAGDSSNSVSKLVRPTLSELKGINSLKQDYFLYNYTLQDLFDSVLFTLKELDLIGFELSDLKAFFSNHTIISSRIFSGHVLKENGIIENGIVFLDFIIIIKGITQYIQEYSLTTENREIKLLFFVDQYGGNNIEIANQEI